MSDQYMKTAGLPQDVLSAVRLFYFEDYRISPGDNACFNRGDLKMPIKFIKRESKIDVPSPDLRMPGNANICPFTLEASEGCKVGNSIDGEGVCVFMLEPCYFLEWRKMRKLNGGDNGKHS